MKLEAKLRQLFRDDLWAADPSAGSLLTRLRIWFLRLLVVVAWEFREHALSLRATGLVYTTLLSLVPFLAVTFSVLKAFGAHQQVEPFLAQLLEPLGAKGGEITRTVVEFVNNLKVGVLGAVGVAGLFVTVVSLLDKIEGALNEIWRVRRPRTLGRKLSDYLSVVLVGPVLVFAALGAIASAQSHWLTRRVLEAELLGPFRGWLVLLAGWLVPFLLLAGAFTFIYRFVPYTRVQLGSALLGGVTAAVLWQLAGAGFAAFLANSARYTAIYSGFAVLILFLIWLYIAWLVILVGGEVAYFHQHPSAYLAAHLRGSHLFREAVALSALLEVTRRHLSGRPPCQPAELSVALNAPLSTVEELIDEFVRRGLVLRTLEPDGIALGRPPEHVTVAEVLETVGDPGGPDTRPLEHVSPAVREILGLRDEAARHALEGLTLRSLVSERLPVDAEHPAGARRR